MAVLLLTSGSPDNLLLQTGDDLLLEQGDAVSAGANSITYSAPAITLLVTVLAGANTITYAAPTTHTRYARATFVARDVTAGTREATFVWCGPRGKQLPDGDDLCSNRAWSLDELRAEAYNQM